MGHHLDNFSAYNTRFAMPAPESGGVLNMWYSYDWGPVHVTVTLPTASAAREPEQPC